MIAAETTKEERIHLLAELKNLSERTGQLEAEIEELYVVRARSQAELENYQLMVADLGY
jgi:molecular chaperone GrpE (heat shock protein)